MSAGWVDMLSRPVDLCKRPNVGDTLEAFTDQLTVTRVYRDGVRVRVTDRIGREWTLERHPTRGHWTRTARAGGAS